MKTKTQTNENITQSELMEILDYDRETGVFRWKKSVGKRVKAGDVAGVIQGQYWAIQINGKACKAHRLAWLYVHGVRPKNQIDHINRNTRDNRIANLREATSTENHQNRKAPSNNTSGHIGVGWCNRSSKWVAYITHERKRKNLGYFHFLNDAVMARELAKLHIHRFHPVNT